MSQSGSPPAGAARQTRAAGAGAPRVAMILWGPSAGRAEEFAAALGGEGWAFFDFGIVSRPSVPLRYLSSGVRTIARLARRRPCSLIVVNPPIFPALIGWAYSRLTGTPLVLDSHPSSFGEKSSAFGRRTLWLHRWLTPRADATLVGTPELADRVRQWGGRPLIVHEAPPIYEPAPAAAAGGRLRVLWAGIFAPDEPIEEVVKAAGLLPDVDFRITGDLRRVPFPVERAPANVTWLGFLRGDSYHEEVQAADAVIALTVDATSALRAAAESIYHLRPLITSDLPHLRELFPTAIFVDNDATGIAAGIGELARADGSSANNAAAARQALLSTWDEQRAALATILGLDQPAGRSK